jgi:hypothetical protein
LIRPAPTELRDSFESSSLDPSFWSAHIGAVPVALSSCGELAASQALHFNGSAFSRRVITQDIDTSMATVFNAVFQLGTLYGNTVTCPPPSTSQEFIVLLYSVDAGMTFISFHTIFSTSFRTPTEVNIALPVAARTRTTRFMIWQPSHSGAGQDVWVCFFLYRLIHSHSLAEH